MWANHVHKLLVWLSIRVMDAACRASPAAPETGYNLQLGWSKGWTDYTIRNWNGEKLQLLWEWSSGSSEGAGLWQISNSTKGHSDIIHHPTSSYRTLPLPHQRSESVSPPLEATGLCDSHDRWRWWEWGCVALGAPLEKVRPCLLGSVSLNKPLLELWAARLGVLSPAVTMLWTGAQRKRKMSQDPQLFGSPQCRCQTPEAPATIWLQSHERPQVKAAQLSCYHIPCP